MLTLAKTVVENILRVFHGRNIIWDIDHASCQGSGFSRAAR